MSPLAHAAWVRMLTARAECERLKATIRMGVSVGQGARLVDTRRGLLRIADAEYTAALEALEQLP